MSSQVQGRPNTGLIVDLALSYAKDKTPLELHRHLIHGIGGAYPGALGLCAVLGRFGHLAVTMLEICDNLTKKMPQNEPNALIVEDTSTPPEIPANVGVGGGVAFSVQPSQNEIVLKDELENKVNQNKTELETAEQQHISTAVNRLNKSPLHSNVCKAMRLLESLHQDHDILIEQLNEEILMPMMYELFKVNEQVTQSLQTFITKFDGLYATPDATTKICEFQAISQNLWVQYVTWGKVTASILDRIESLTAVLTYLCDVALHEHSEELPGKASKWSRQTSCEAHCAGAAAMVRPLFELAQLNPSVASKRRVAFDRMFKRVRGGITRGVDVMHPNARGVGGV